MSRSIPQVRRWLVNYWAGGKVIASDKVDAPTKFLAILILRDHCHYVRQPEAWTHRTITPIRKAG